MIGAILIKAVRSGKFAENLLYSFSLVLIMAGAMGNLIDRLTLRYVIDFIDVKIWPVFNIADSSITIGTALLIISFTKSRLRT